MRKEENKEPAKREEANENEESIKEELFFVEMEKAELLKGISEKKKEVERLQRELGNHQEELKWLKEEAVKAKEEFQQEAIRAGRVYDKLRDIKYSIVGERENQFLNDLD